MTETSVRLLRIDYFDISMISQNFFILSFCFGLSLLFIRIPIC